MLSVEKQNRKINWLLFLCITLAVLNYTAGVIVYRGYIQRLSSTSAVCQIFLKSDSLHGEININPPDDLAVFPVDYQIYFYDQKGDTLQLVANSLNGQLRAVFDVPIREKLFSTQWHVVGYSNIRIKWLWLSMNLTLPVEVEVR